MAEVILSNRMQALTDMVTPGTVITDVGCDHGFVSVYLVQRGLSPRVIAMDVRSGPLERAREHIREYGLQDRIETRLSDGLHGLKTGEANGMICAGMGGPLMEKILTEGREQAQGFAELILQPQSEIGKVRRFLNEHRLQIIEENMVEEDGKFYPMMKVIHGEKEEYTVCEYTYGKCLLKQRHPVLKKYLDREMAIKEHVFGQLFKHQNSESAARRMEELKKEIILTQEALKYYE